MMTARVFLRSPLRRRIRAVFAHEGMGFLGGRDEPLVIHLDVPFTLLVHHMSARRSCPKCGRIYNLVGSPPLVAGLCDEDGNVLIQMEDDRDAVFEQRLDE